MRAPAFLAAPLLAAVCSGLGAQSAPEARRTVEQATQAFEGDGATALVTRWTAALQRDSGDRLASLGLATASRLTFRYDEAQRRYRALMGSSRSHRDGVALYARLGQALALATQSNPRVADTALAGAAAAAHAAHDSAGEVEMLLPLARLRARLTTPAGGAAVLRGVDKLIPAGQDRLAAQYRCTAIPLHALPPGVDIRDAARTGAALARAAGDRVTEGLCRFELADALEHSGDLIGAVSVLDTLERDVLPPTDRSHLAVLRQHRGDDERTLGDYGAAMRSFRTSIAAGEASKNFPAVAFAKMGLAEIYRTLGDLTAATQAVEGAAASFTQSGDRIGRMIADGLQGNIALDAGDVEGARAAFQAEHSAAITQSEWAYLTLAQLGLADVATRGRAWAQADRWLEAAGSTITSHRLQGIDVPWRFARGTVALHEGRLGDAAQDLDASLRGLGRQQHGERYLSIARLAEIDVARGDTARAEQELTKASLELDQWRSTLQDADLRVLAFQRQNSFGADDPGVARVIAAVAKAGRTTAAFELAERRRARDLADRIELSIALGSAGRSTAAPGGVADSTGAAEKDVTSLRTVQATLPDDRTALLEYVAGTGSAPTTLFAITRSAARSYVLPSGDSLATAIQRFNAVLAGGTPAHGAADALGPLLFGPALAEVGGSVTRLVIVPDGAVHRTPFAAVRVTGTYVIERFAVSTAPSASVAARLWQRPKITGPATVLALGDARFPREVAGGGVGGTEAEVYRSAFDESGGMPRLPGSAEEARVVARFADRAVVRLRDSASAAFLKRTSLDSFRIIHLATHAIVDDQATTRTALALAAGGGESGFVTPADLAGLRLHADLVVLSACRAAGGRIIAGEGVRGLTAPLLGAGARAVVASQWVIGDRRTVRLMHDFYRALAEGQPADEALRQAELSALRRGAAPREWAAFTLSGDPTVQVPLSVPRFDWVWRLLH